MTTATVPTAAHPARTGAVTSAPLSGLVAFALLDLRRRLRDRVEMFFVVALPAFMYVVFGLGSDDAVGSGNVAMYVMLSLAAYGAVSATSSIAAAAVLERSQGWGRQLALTPMSPLAFVGVKTAVAMTIAAAPVAIVLAIGAATGARGTGSDWLLGGVLVWAGSSLFAVYGVAVCAVFRSENAAGIASGLVVVMAFLGNVFVPLSGVMLDIGRFTPLYGYVALARYPLTDGWSANGTHDPLWLPIANVLTWTLIFALMAVRGLRRGQERV